MGVKKEIKATHTFDLGFSIQRTFNEDTLVDPRENKLSTEVL